MNNTAVDFVSGELLIAQYYDRLFNFPDDKLLIDALKLSPIGKIVDLGCGPARSLIALRDCGRPLVGVDHWPEMLHTAQRKLNLAGVDASLLRADFVNDDLAINDAGLVFCMAHTWMIQLTSESRIRTLKAIQKMLVKDGIFLFTVALPPPSLTGRSQQIPIGNFMLTAEINPISYDDSAGILKSNIRFSLETKDNPIIEEYIFETAYASASTLLDEIKTSGLHIHEVFGDLNRQPLNSQSRILIVIAKK